MNQPLVSVIMPIWGVEKYIRHSLDSILNQTYSNIEYILVNDCTKDSSMEIVQELLDIEKYKEKVVCIYTHDKNRGLAASRNTGLNHSKGKYVICVDSDDYFEPLFIEKMVICAEYNSSDIVLCDYFVTYLNYERYVKQRFVGTGVELCKLLLDGKLQGFTWNKLIRRELFEKHGISFTEGVDMWEDMSVIPCVSYYARNVSCVPQAFIHYNQTNVNSYSTSRLSERSVENIKKAVEIISSFFSSSSKGIDVRYLDSLKLRAKSVCLVNTRGKARKEVSRLYSELNMKCFAMLITPIYCNFILIAALFKMFMLIDFIWFGICFFRKLKH